MTRKEREAAEAAEIEASIRATNDECDQEVACRRRQAEKAILFADGVISADSYGDVVVCGDYVARDAG